jgi:hypothetical protein
MTGFKTKLTPKELKDLRKLHNLVIHKRGGLSKQLFLESKKVAQLGTDELLLKVCRKCFKKPN